MLLTYMPACLARNATPCEPDVCCGIFHFTSSCEELESCLCRYIYRYITHETQKRDEWSCIWQRHLNLTSEVRSSDFAHKSMENASEAMPESAVCMWPRLQTSSNYSYIMAFGWDFAGTGRSSTFQIEMAHNEDW